MEVKESSSQDNSVIQAESASEIDSSPPEDQNT